MDNQQSKPAEQMFAEIMRIFQEHHSTQIKKQVARAMKSKAEAGYWLHRPPFGYSPTGESGRYKINRQGRALRELMQKFAKGSIPKEYFHFSLCYVLDPCPRSVATISGIRQLVSNSFYIGKVSHNGELYDGIHEPLISIEEQQKILKKLKK